MRNKEGSTSKQGVHTHCVLPAAFCLLIVPNCEAPACVTALGRSRAHRPAGYVTPAGFSPPPHPPSTLPLHGSHTAALPHPSCPLRAPPAAAAAAERAAASPRRLTGDKKPVPAPPQPRLPGRCRRQDGGAASRRCVVPRPAPPGRAGDPVAATCCRRARCCSCCSWCCCRCPRCSCPRCCCRLGRRRPRASCTPRRKMRVQCAVSRGGGLCVCVLGGAIK